jgi:hypothetical protein
MKPLSICALLFALTPGLIGQQVEQPGIQADEVTGRMLARDMLRESLSQGYSGTRRYLLENERLNKRAELVAAVRCETDGTKHFSVLSETGWQSANSRVLRKMLESEAETSSPQIRPRARLTADNYDFSMAGTEVVEGRPTYVINVIPKRRDKYLMEGRVWVDATDYALVRAEGKPARNPSFWTHSVHFVQQYQKQGAFWFPASTESITEARIFGTTHVKVTYINYTPNTQDFPVSKNRSLREIGYANR